MSTAPKGYPSSKNLSRVVVQHANVEPVSPTQDALAVLARVFVELVASDLVEANSTVTVVNATAHKAKRGSLIRFTSGALIGVEVRVHSVSANTIMLSEDLESIPATGAGFDILRNRAPLVAADGVIPVEAVLDVSTLATEVTLSAVLAALGGTISVDDAGGSLTVDDGGGSLTVDGAVSVSNAAGGAAVNVQDGGNVLSVDDGGGSLTIDGTVAISNGAGGAAVNVQDGGNVLSVDDAGGSLTIDGSVAITNGAGGAAVNVQDGGNVLSIDDAGGSLTVDGTVAVSNAAGGAAVNIQDGGNSISVDDGAGSLTVDGSVGVTNGAGGAAVNIQDGGNVISIDDGGASLTVDGSVGVTNGAGGAAVNVQDGGNSLTIDSGQLPAALGQTTMANSFAVVLASDQSTLPVTQAGRDALAKALNDYTVTQVTSAAYVQLIASVGGTAIKEVEIFDSSGQPLILATGGAGAEVDRVYITPGGNGRIPLAIAANARVAVKALDATAAAGILLVNFYG